MGANLDKIEPIPGEKAAAVERQETHNEEVATHPLRACRNQGTACQETMEARLEEEKPASMEMKPEVADEEVPLEDAVEMPVGEPRKRRRDQRRNLAAVRRQKKEQDQNLDARRRRKEQNRTLRKNGC
jgi:hypothetical protein